MQRAPAVTLDHRGPFILGPHALDLEQQSVFGAPADLAVQDNDRHAQTLALIDQQHLIGICTCQPLRRVPRETVNSPRSDQVPQPLQRWTDQGRPTGAFIQERHPLGQDQPIGGDTVLSGRALAGDRVRIGVLC
jgi:hypothetical protein